MPKKIGMNLGNNNTSYQNSYFQNIQNSGNVRGIRFSGLKSSMLRRLDGSVSCGSCGK